jgi:chorismate dehydratase
MRFRIGSVSYLNAKPLIHGLDQDPDLDVNLDVPAKLLDGLQSRRFDIALLPVIDYQRLPGLRIVPSGGIGCDGPTLTVRIFSPVPIPKIQTLACDTESHTSVALARIILAQQYGITPKTIDLDPSQNSAMLLIGDKVVTHAPVGMPHQLDLGDAWKQLTGMPFVFAVWIARAGVDLADLPQRLERAKRAGLADLQTIIDRHAIPHGWPRQLALQYLTVNLKFDIGPAQLEAIKLFHQMAAQQNLIPPPRPLDLFI